eukprot:1746253-Amphidinium_carterae.2
MAWENPNAVAQLINSLKALGVSPGFSNRRGGTAPAGSRGGTAPGQQPVEKGSKKWSAQTQGGTVRIASKQRSNHREGNHFPLA